MQHSPSHHLRLASLTILFYHHYHFSTLSTFRKPYLFFIELNSDERLKLFFKILKEIVSEWLKNHPVGSIDDIFAHYIDPTDTIYRSYQVRSNTAL